MEPDFPAPSSPPLPAGSSERLDVALQRLSPAIVNVWMIKSGIAALLIILAAGVYDLATALTGNGGVLPAGVVSFVILVLAITMAIGVPRLRYKFWRYSLQDEELFLERGIFNRVKTVVPLRRIQHLDVSQDIIEREFSLGKLIVHTAGTRSSDVVLPGLNIDEANRLRDVVKDYIIEDAV